ncbi:SLC13 family permease [Desulfonatronovibrio hydrogenovorans]|uniref:SLC13 family permease n=1 Tax=Desulfonatronovibrio hydrogenovorans TaxID=53245 RepID=UPI0004915FBD|nr:SLC13 family permease [Desulfonatronovibrio hydrogenovorans]
MTLEIALVLVILLIAVFLLVTEVIPMEATALLVLSSLAITGLVSYSEALSGFSSPAVVTVWAVFILSGGLTQTGVANAIGRQVMRFSGQGEARLIILIMISSGVMSAFMNNVAVAALLLPVIMDITRKTGHSPSRLLMPLAYGCLLGGLTTQIGTPPNILVSEALRDNNLTPFSMFDFTPIGGTIMVGGIIFLSFFGRHFLPSKSLAGSAGIPQADLTSQYDIKNHLLNLRVPRDSYLAGKNLIQSRLGEVLGITVLGITRHGQSLLAPPPSTLIQPGDILVCGGREDLVREILDWSGLQADEPDHNMLKLVLSQYKIAEITIKPDSPVIGKRLLDLDLYSRHGLTILAFYSDQEGTQTELQDLVVTGKETVLVIGDSQSLTKAGNDENLVLKEVPVSGVLEQQLRQADQLLAMKVPEETFLAGRTLGQSGLGNTLGMRVILIVRNKTRVLKPDPDTVLAPGDMLIITGARERLAFLKLMAKLDVSPAEADYVQGIENEKVGLMEVMLSPHTTLINKTLSQINFREKHGLTVLAIWREGKAIFSGIRDIPLRLGDAILTHGSREKLKVLGKEPDFLVLTESAQAKLRTSKLPVSVMIMASVLFPVIMGWLPISIAAVCGASLMVLSKCLTMEEAYRYIEWKAIFLIAGMMPLGVALDQTGAARLIAENIVTLVGPYGPLAVMFGMVVMTFAATCVIPTAALVVLMVPIVLSTSADMGVSPYPMMMAMSMAASASFMTPISHPANVLVMGPGGYRFMDYIKLGVPLTMVVLVILMFFLPVLWPFQSV